MKLLKSGKEAQGKSLPFTKDIYSCALLNSSKESRGINGDGHT